ncbi:MAG: HEPN domain-containing protein [Candidatus Marinimicrobia bacterium]|nr:HEPN domain-containing protein [Candidatus Neomarinimicrobiota bacterium]
MNKTSAQEWLVKAYHDLSSAHILFEANHFTDSIGVDLHYCIEKILKSFLAYRNKKIPRTHDLNELYAHVEGEIELKGDELDLLDIVTEYHIEESYPTPDKTLPPREEIKEVLDFTQGLFGKVCDILKINMNDVTG